MDAIRSKIAESRCDIVCVQETKREFFNAQYIRNFCPRHIDSFEFLPSVGASGGSIVLWNNSKFIGNMISQNEFSQSVELQCLLSGENWILTNIYATCTPERKLASQN